MTTETMREAVARAFLLARGYPPETIDKDFPAIVKRYQEMCADWPDYYNAFSLVTDAFRDADISIRTVLERLREPSETMWTAGRDPILARDGRMPASMLVEQSWYDPERDCAGRKDGYVTKGDCAVWVWRAMLDAAAREVG